MPSLRRAASTTAVPGFREGRGGTGVAGQSSGGANGLAGTAESGSGTGGGGARRAAIPSRAAWAGSSP